MSWVDTCARKRNPPCLDIMIEMMQLGLQVYPLLQKVDDARRQSSQESDESQQHKQGSKPPLHLDPMSIVEDIKSSLRRLNASIDNELRPKTQASRAAEKILKQMGKKV